jgi:hypothetical protein
MSSNKEQKQLQRFHDARVIKKRVTDWNHYPQRDAAIKPSNKWNKRNAFNCGQSNCVMCGNPRRSKGEVTVQELAVMESFEYALKHI